MALEEEFGFEIPDNEADKIDAINVAVDFIASHPQAKWDFYQWGMLIDLFVRFFMRPSLSVLMTWVIWKFWFHHMLMITKVLRFEIIWYSWPSTVGSFLLRYLTCWRWFAFAASLVNMLCFAMFFFPFLLIPSIYKYCIIMCIDIYIWISNWLLILIQTCNHVY